MRFLKTVATLTALAILQIPCAVDAAEEDRELALIAAEQEDTGDEKLDDLNPALTESLTTEQEEDTDKEKRERRRKLRETRREKEKENERKLRESTQRDKKRNAQERESPIVIDPMEPENESPPVYQPPQPQPTIEPPQPEPTIEPPPVYQPPQPQPQPVAEIQPQPVEQDRPEPSQFTVPINNQPVIEQQSSTTTVAMPNPKVIYANFSEVARALHFTPLYMPRKSGYEIMEIYAIQNVAEVKYGRRWEPNVSLTVRTYRRADGEEPSDISGVTGVKWRVDTTTGTTIYIAKISETQQVAAWAVGRYTFSALSNNLSFAGFHSLVADELVELSTHYYLDI